MTEAPDFPEETTPLGMGSPAEFSEPDANWQTDFDGLLHIGRLYSKFEWLHHSFRIRTLNDRELLIVALLVAEWNETIGGTRAYATAMVALALEYVDGQPMPSPIGESADEIKWARERFNWTQRLFPYTIDAVYNRYLELEARVIQILNDMGKDSGQGDATPGLSESSGSPTEEGS